METKKRSTAVVTEATAQAALRRGPARTLTAEEERVLRMRVGASPARTAPLERAAPERSDLEIELLSYEIEAYMKWRAREEARAPSRAAPAARPSRAKEKIIRALRKKA
ncbi:hypothetical protein [Anaeromyxobacter oryzisoli]|uniref:hypothetical protein n=1 Tax=Anaeromyxobacter oryzisoli TaxID=2925408 RepID=UPI0027DFB8E4|nr:hypothetical protein [Anaeromyxobacter sp. SG63]